MVNELMNYYFFKAQTFLECKYQCLIKAVSITKGVVSIKVRIFKNRVSLMKVLMAIVKKLQDQTYINFHTLNELKID